jgi:hypothetical protein
MADASQNQSSISGQVRSIAEAAIHSINQLTSLIENRPSTVPDASANSRTSNTLGPSTPRLTTNTALESPRLVLNQAAAVNVQRRQTSVRSRNLGEDSLQCLVEQEKVVGGT